MIFLSHNYRDKAIVEQVALKLRSIYGQDKVFYDSWSIQPGDGIIDKMEHGLTNCRYFFFFVSANSLASNMVKMEWQNALFKAAQSAIVFIPIRMDNSVMPTLLCQSLYIDLYSMGLEVTVRQIVDVIDGRNTYREPRQSFSNLLAIKYREGNKVVVECRAQHYLEPISHFAFCTKSPLNNIKYNVRGELMVATNMMENAKLNNGYTTNIHFLGVEHGTTPEMPFVVEFESANGDTFDIEAVLHKINHKEYRPIPMTIK